MGYRRYRYGPTTPRWSDGLALFERADRAGPWVEAGSLVECGDDVPLYEDVPRPGTPDPARDVAAALALVEAVMPNRGRVTWNTAADDGTRYVEAGLDGPPWTVDADAPTLPRALTILALRAAALRDATR